MIASRMTRIDWLLSRWRLTVLASRAMQIGWKCSRVCNRY